MESTPVNWEALDALVIEFAKSENLIEDSSSAPSPSPSSSPSSSSSSSSYQSRLVIRQIRRSLESGAVDAAVDLLRLHAPSILNDHRILFRLHKQNFIELLRNGTVENRDSAIDCLRTALAPCALDAYPEAYEEFKHVLLAFIYDKDDMTSPVANEVLRCLHLFLQHLSSPQLSAFSSPQLCTFCSHPKHLSASSPSSCSYIEAAVIINVPSVRFCFLGIGFGNKSIYQWMG